MDLVLPYFPEVSINSSFSALDPQFSFESTKGGIGLLFSVTFARQTVGTGRK